MSSGDSSVDLAFAMDCTGSMGSYIKSATDNIRMIVDEIISKEKITIRLALVEYRDHPPQDETFITRVHSFSSSVTEAKQWLEGCSAQGGGDAPEAVADALNDVLNLSWQNTAAKVCILISDAPPHGLVKDGDKFPDGCPLGHDPLAIVRKMAEKQITLYTVGVEPSIVPYRDFFMTLAHLTGGQYVPMVDANRLAQMIVAGIREEISIDRLMTTARPDIKREMRRSQKDGVDDSETARRLQKLFNSKNLRVSQMNNVAGKPSRVAEESYSKCVDMSDMQHQYQQSQVPTTTQSSSSSTLDYNLQENSEVSFEQSKRIVQKAKNWDYSVDDDEPTERKARRPCKHGSKCYDHTTAHRADFTHPRDETSTITRSSHVRNDNSRPACKYGANCTDDTSHHLTKFSHPDRYSTMSTINRSNRTECRYGSNCRDHNEDHRSKFTHPESEDLDTYRTNRNTNSDRHSYNKTECRYGSKCRDNSDYHRSKYSHP